MYLKEAPSGGAIDCKTIPVNHNHRPTGHWAAVQRASQSRCRALELQALSNPRRAPQLAEQIAFQCACARLSPQEVALVAKNVMRVLPLAKRHLEHYLAGSGADFKEDFADVIRRDRKVRAKFAVHIKARPRGHFKLNQSDFDVKDFQFAFGAIDRVEYEVNRAAGTVHVWFRDRYEWHPVGFGYSHCPDDVARGSNCVHAAMVEMKNSGAKDYWMVTDIVIPLRLVLGGAPPSRPAPKARHDFSPLQMPLL